jgi:hypothetical protein
VQPRHIDLIQPFVEHRVYGEHGDGDLLGGSWAVRPLDVHGHQDGALGCRCAGVGAKGSRRELDFS